MMGEMLSFVGSRSSAYVLFNENRESRPDENFSREIMQLFSIGIYMLNQDGSIQYDDNGSPVPSYDNTDIQTLARAWTGFTRHNRRGNREGYDQQFNRLDPMHIESVRRDQFPKMDLMKGYIGDTYPLCEDLPERQFLRIGAEYRLLGSHPLPILHSEPTDWENLNSLMRFSPSPDSALYNLLCNPDGSGDCHFIPRIKLKENLDCFGDECELDSIRVVLFGDVYYEYIRPPCVELSFYLPEELSKVVDKWNMALCLHKKVPDGAMASCCDQASEKIASNYCEFTVERVSWETSDSRCKAKGFHMCDVKHIQFPDQKCDFHKSDSNEYFEFVWSNATCSIQARVESDGVVALVHNPSLDPEDGQYVLDRVNATNPNSFKVMWTDSLYPSTSNQCGSDACQKTSDGCLCRVTVDHNVAFTAMPSLSDIQAKLKIGSPNPESFDPAEYTLVTTKRAVIRIYQQTDEDVFSKNTIFSINHYGKRIFLKNVVSSVSIGTEFSFRNPPRFMSFTSPEGRDAAYETDSVLDNYFHHPNTPPFVAMRLIQRFGHSNPSPRYISMVSTAFKSGVYDVKKLPTFGNGDYGNLEATVAAILLDREAVSFALDADPSVGSLREVSHDINHIVILLLPSSIAHIFGLRQYRDYRESPLLNSFPS
jgi:cullin-associated NEDD8-dissociated protein 1